MPAGLIKKAVLPIAGLGTRFLPLSKTFPKELWPLLNRPVLDYIVEEVRDAGAKEVVFVNSPGKKIIEDYFKPDRKMEKVLEKRDKKELLLKLKKSQNNFQNLKFSSVIQKKPLGDGHAILQAKAKIGKNPFMVSFGDDIIVSKVPCLLQMARAFAKYGQPMIALKKVTPERISFYGVPRVEKIGPRTYRIKEIVEKPKPSEAPSSFAMPGKYILTPEIFKYLEKTKSIFKGEIILANALEQMIKDGKMVYGYEFEGDWLECGNVSGWLKANLFLAKKHPEFKRFFKTFNE